MSMSTAFSFASFDRRKNSLAKFLPLIEQIDAHIKTFIANHHLFIDNFHTRKSAIIAMLKVIVLYGCK